MARGGATSVRMTEITVAALQLAFTPDIERNVANVSRLVREAAGRGAQVILPPELFEGEYFCRIEDEGRFAQARAVDEAPCSASIARVTSPTGRAMRRSSISAPATPASAYGPAPARRSASAYAGTNGSPRRRAR